MKLFSDYEKFHKRRQLHKDKTEEEEEGRLILDEMMK